LNIRSLPGFEPKFVTSTVVAADADEAKDPRSNVAASSLFLIIVLTLKWYHRTHPSELDLGLTEGYKKSGRRGEDIAAATYRRALPGGLERAADPC
jgi:hypothetical protein